MKSSKLSFLIEFPKFKRRIRNLNDYIFFFPFYQFGGAERVHLDILGVFNKDQTTCFITENSSNDFFKKEFETITNLIPFYKLKSKKYKIYPKTLANAINQKKTPIVFGCNSAFFYELIPFLEDHVKVVDMIHAFSYEEPFSAEKLSIPVADRINKRVVLGNKTKLDFKELYRKNDIPERFMERIVTIKNKVKIPESLPEKPRSCPLKILFVARNSFEKRPHYVTEIARVIANQNPDITFSFVGEFEKDFCKLPNVEVLGPIESQEAMQQIYREHHLLLTTSFREGFPMVIAEGMANGVVPISTNVGEISEIINDENQNGLLVDDPNLEMYASSENRITNKFLDGDKERDVLEKFVKLILQFKNNPELLEKYRLNAYRIAADKFSSKNFMEAYENLFNSLQKES